MNRPPRARVSWSLERGLAFFRLLWLLFHDGRAAFDAGAERSWHVTNVEPDRRLPFSTSMRPTGPRGRYHIHNPLQGCAARATAGVTDTAWSVQRAAHIGHVARCMSCPAAGCAAGSHAWNRGT